SLVQALNVALKLPAVRAARQLEASTCWMSTLTPILDHSSFKMMAVLIRSWLLFGISRGSVNPFGTDDAAISASALATLYGYPGPSLSTYVPSGIGAFMTCAWPKNTFLMIASLSVA